MYRLELASMEELETCSRILEEGRLFQRQQGFVQWEDDYPNADTLRQDILAQKGYVVKIGEKIAGYLCIEHDVDPAYEAIEGSWHTAAPYASVHRIAIGDRFRGKGLAHITFSLIKQHLKKLGTEYLRIDTHPENLRMQHILEKNGFLPCGTIQVRNSGRIAYDKILF